MSERISAAYYRSISGATENGTDPKPITVEAIYERKRAIREGRLTVVDTQDPGGGRLLVCTGCAAETPRVNRGDGNGFVPMAPPGGSPISGLGFYNFGAHTGTNQAGYGVRLEIEDFQVGFYSGGCKREGSDCTQMNPCAWIAEIEFKLEIFIQYLEEEDNALPAPTLPNFTIRDPVTGQTTSQLTPVTASIVANGGSISASYFWINNGSLACGSGLTMNLSLDPSYLNPVPATGSWTLSALPPPIGLASAAPIVQITCSSCAKGGAFPS